MEGTVKTANGYSAVIENGNGTFTVDAAHARLTPGEICEVCVRTERMKASREPVEGFNLVAAVKEVRYAGASVLTYVNLKDGTEVACEGSHRLCDAAKPGETVYLNWNPTQAAVIGGASHGA